MGKNENGRKEMQLWVQEKSAYCEVFDFGAIFSMGSPAILIPCNFNPASPWSP
jgi:hypothetical protein